MAPKYSSQLHAVMTVGLNSSACRHTTTSVCGIVMKWSECWTCDLEVMGATPGRSLSVNNLCPVFHIQYMSLCHQAV